MRHSLTLLIELLPATFLTSGILSVLIVNNSGSFLAGLFMNKITDETLRLIFITGFLGSFTTFSTFSREGMNLFYEKNWIGFSSFIILNAIGSLLFYHLGYGVSNR